MKAGFKFWLHGLMLLCSAVFSKTAAAQDTLILQDKTELPVKVLEVGEKTITYKKASHLTGPNYSIDLAKVFMVLYKNGRRELFNTKPEATGTGLVKSAANVAKSKEHTLSNDLFELRLVETHALRGNRKTTISIGATVQVYAGGKLFSELTVAAYQRTDARLDYSNPDAGYLGKSSFVVSVKSERLQQILYEKYESNAGKGHGWALPPQFFAPSGGPCSVALVQQRSANKEVLSGIGGLSSTKYNLKDCTTPEQKLLSAVLVWLEVNFANR